MDMSGLRRCLEAMYKPKPIKAGEGPATAPLCDSGESQGTAPPMPLPHQELDFVISSISGSQMSPVLPQPMFVPQGATS